MALYRIDGKTPQVALTAYVAVEASIVGQVSVGERSSVWPGAAIRGDNDPITIGDCTSIQEGAVLHADPGFPILVGSNVTVGHQAMLHGCTVGDGSLIGIQAVVLNGAVIGRNCLVAAGAVVTERKVFPDNVLIVGAPATVKRELTQGDLDMLSRAARVYAHKADLYREKLERVG